MTLVEVMVVVALLSIVMGVVVSLLVELRKWDRKLRNVSSQAEQSLRLADVLRADIRQGTSVLLPAGHTLVIMSHEDTQTRYELAPDGCRRTVGDGNKVVASRDLFSIGPATSWSLEPGPPGRLPLFMVSLHRTEVAGDLPLRFAPFLLYAALGADAALAEAAPAETTNPTP